MSHRDTAAAPKVSPRNRVREFTMWRSVLLGMTSVGIAAGVIVLIASGQGSIVLVAGGALVAAGAAAINDELRIVSPETAALGFYPFV